MSKDEVKEMKIVKTTIRVPEALWMRAKTRAIQERTSAQELIILALLAYLKGGK